MTIPIGVIGRIVNLGEEEPFILVVDDISNTGGYLILMSNFPAFEPANDLPAITGPTSWLPENNMDPAHITGHDYWALEDDLEAFFLEAGWDIEWADSNRSLPGHK